MSDSARVDWVDTDRMGVVTPQVEELAQKTLDAQTFLLEALGRLCNAPGVDDEAALAFRAAHDPLSESAVGAMQDFIGIANNILAGIRTVVHDYTATEEGNTVPPFPLSERHRTVGKPLLAAREMAVKSPSDVPVETGHLRQGRLLGELPADQTPNLPVAHPNGVPTKTPRFVRSTHELPADSPVDDLP